MAASGPAAQIWIQQLPWRQIRDWLETRINTAGRDKENDGHPRLLTEVNPKVNYIKTSDAPPTLKKNKVSVQIKGRELGRNLG